jgi:hypothetical protein
MAWTPEQEASAGFKMMMTLGFEWKSSTQSTDLLVNFGTPEISHKVRDQMIADGFTVIVCPNQSWLAIQTNRK